MAILLTPPENIGFSRNRIIWQFEDDLDGIIPGTVAVNNFSVGNAVLAGQEVFLRWGDKEVIFEASAAPNAAIGKMPTYPVFSAGTLESYIDQLVVVFQANYKVNEDFIVSKQIVEIGAFLLPVIYFTSRKNGSKFNFASVVFANGSGVGNITKGTDDSTIVNNSVFVELWAGDQESEDFTRIWKGSLQYDKENTARVDVAPILHAELKSEMPDFTLAVAQKCKDSRRKYFLKYAPSGGEVLTIGELQTGPQHVVLLGGMSEKNGAPKTVIATLKNPVNTQDKLLMIQSRTRYIRRDEPVFVSWVNFGTAGKNVYARATVTFSDGTSVITNTGVVQSVGVHEKLMFAVGYKQLNLLALTGTVQEYTVQLRDDEDNVSEPFRLVLDYAHQEYIRYFAHINSFGGVETIKTYGRGSQSWKVFKESAEKVMPFQFGSGESQFVEWDLKYQDNAEVASGFMPKAALKNFLDFFISPVKLRIIKGMPYAIAVNTDTINRGTDGDNQYGVTFEYQFQRIFDSLDEYELEGEDVQDYIPSNVQVAGNLPSGSAPSDGYGTAIRVDPYPIFGSTNAVESNALFVLLSQKQDALPIGDATQYYRPDGRLMNLKTAVNAAETDPTVPGYAKTLTSAGRIAADLQEMTPGINVNLFGGLAPDWYKERFMHPTFALIPPVVVEKNVQFTKYLDLSVYKTSYHQLTDLTVSVEFNSMFFDGVTVTVDGLLLKIEGKIVRAFEANERLILVVKDNFDNDKTIGIKIEALETEEPENPENPDTRPTCPRGPNHYPQKPLEVLSNSDLRIPYDGQGVARSEWKIVKEQSDIVPLRAGDQGPENNGPFLRISFDALPGGDYWVGIRGFSCKSNWDYRKISIAVDTTLDFAENYPKYEGGVFKVMIDQSLQLLTEVYNATTNMKLYSIEYAYVANVTEVDLEIPGGWPDAHYRINVGSLTASLTVGTPPDPIPTKFLLVSAWDGNTIADLATGNYEGPLPTSGFNVMIQSSDIGFVYNNAEIQLEIEVAGLWVEIPGAFSGFGLNSGTTNQLIDPFRLFSTPGVDSRHSLYNGLPINRYGKFRVIAPFKLDNVVVSTFQSIFAFNLLEIGGSEVMTGGTTRAAVVLRSVLYNKANVVNDNVWAYPFGGANNLLEFNVNGGNTWYNLSAIWDNFGDIDGTSKIWLLNDEAVDLFPPGETRVVRLRMQANHSIVSAPISINVAGSGGNETIPVLLGTYSAEVGGKKYTFQKSPAFSLKFESDGSITDDTPGLVHGSPSKINGKNVFYMIGYSYLVDNGDAVHLYRPLRNLFLPDEIFTVRQFVCDAGKIPNQAAFEANISGYPEGTGVNRYNATLSEITISIRTTANPAIRASRVVTRKLDFLNSSPNRAMGGKVFAIEMINRGESPSIYHAKGVHTATTGEHGTVQPNTCRTYKWPYDLHPGDPVFTDSDLYNSLRGHILGFGLTPLSVITDEYPENAQGQDPAIGSRCGIAHRGAMDLFRDQYPGISKRSTNLYGSYGGDNFYGLVDPQFVSKYPKSVVAQYLNEKVFRGMDPSTGIFRDHDVDFYTSQQYLDRNVNVGYYMYNGIYNIPMELLCANERIKIGTKTHNGEDNECDWMVFATILSQSLVTDNSGNWAGVEDTRTGDVIPFSNGEIISKFNTPISAVAGEHFTLGYWATLLGRGIMLWSGGGSYGTDSSKIDNYQPAGQPIYWIKNGGSREDYQSGFNGAPIRSIDGMKDVLYATVVNTTKAGHDAARELEGYIDTLYYSSYSSSRKSFTALPGTAGFHLNGFGALNIGQLAFKDALDQKCGTSLIGVGPSGKVGIYYNGQLSAHEYEDNVTLTHDSMSVNLGRVYGRQTKSVKFN